MKKTIAALLALLLVLPAPIPVAAATSYYYNGSKAVKYTKGAYKAFYDNKLITGEDNEPAVVINDNVMLPYKQALIEKGPKMKGNYKNKVVTLYNNKIKVTMTLDKKIATITNLGTMKSRTATLNTPAKKVKYNGHTAIYVPAKKIASFFGFSYNYKSSSKSLYMAHVHSWGSYTVTQKATCTAAGSKVRTCSTCGAKQTASIAATGHKWDSGRKSGNSTIYTCTVCKQTKTVKGTQASAFLSMTHAQFFDAVGKMAKDYYKKHGGVLPSITVAQAIQESGYGTTDLAQGGNNIFGMKINLSGNNWAGSTWDGKSYFEKESWESYGGKRVLVRSRFRKYACVEDNIADHAMYLYNSKKENGSYRYPAMRKKSATYTDQLNSLVSGGYCTFGTYTDSLKKHIKNYNLTKYDK